MENTPLPAAGGALPAALTSRRALLAGLAIAPAAIGATAMMPAVAVAAVPTPDPIFEVIAKWQKAKAAWHAALNAHSDADEELGKARKASRRTLQVGEEIRLEDDEIVSRSPVFASTLKELHRHLGMVKHFESDPICVIKRGRKIVIREEVAPNIEEVREELIKGHKATSGPRKKERRANQRVGHRYDVYAQACRDVFGTVPRSKEGLIALLGVWKDDQKDQMQDEGLLLVETIEAYAKGGANA